MIFGSPALRWLVRAKLRGTLRKQLRRLKQPSGIILGILGFLIFGFWFLSLALGVGLQGSMFEEETDARLVRLGCLAMALITVTGAFSHRGVVMPREEIERLFAAPVSRADIVRYRMLTNSGRYLLSGVVFALFVSRHLPHPIFGPASVFVAMLTLPLLGQTAALLLGSAEHRFADSWRKGTRAKLLRGITLVLVFGVILFMTFGRDLVHLPSLENVSDLGDRVLDWPPVRYVLALFTPWSNAMVSTTKEEFGPSFGILIAFWIVLFEFAARLPVDFRELSLDTSANVAKRIREMR
ncbi:MAG: putative ABC exporter domain-containing protein, partial [Planctomycetota bacterium]